MFSAMRRRVRVTPATVIAGLALVFAMTGGAYAAKKYLITSTKQISPSVLKALQGKAGAAGAPGVAGAQGPAGLAGPAGPKGENGSSGKEGKQGEPGKAGKDGVTGKSVEVTKIDKGEPVCEKQGGAEYAVEGSGVSTEICNGKEGSPWAVGGLPKGATETGAWSFNASQASADEEGKVFVSFSLPVPMSTPITSSAKVHITGFEGDSTCTGVATKPTAPEGMMCIYEAEVFQATFLFATELLGEQHFPDPSGGFLVFHITGNNAYGRGSWAITSG